MQLNDADWPTFGWIADVRPALREASRGGRSVVLATLTGQSGAAPRPIGTQMVFDGAAATGYFSGGCLEADVANHAAVVLADGAPRRLVYGEGSPWIDVRLVCGGRIEILLERIAPDDDA
ncbi:MAG: XdhC family protein, partial [Sphingomonadales bacterium]|nr:XdhC family protein [Sphingomonadales bacterium]